MARNFQESEIARSVATVVETTTMTLSASVSIILAKLVVIDIGRNDFPNTILEAAGTILGIALATIAGKELIKGFKSSLHAQSTPPTK